MTDSTSTSLGVDVIATHLASIKLFGSEDDKTSVSPCISLPTMGSIHPMKLFVQGTSTSPGDRSLGLGVPLLNTPTKPVSTKPKSAARRRSTRKYKMKNRVDSQLITKQDTWRQPGFLEPKPSMPSSHANAVTPGASPLLEGKSPTLPTDPRSNLEDTALAVATCQTPDAWGVSRERGYLLTPSRPVRRRAFACPSPRKKSRMYDRYTTVSIEN